MTLEELEAEAMKLDQTARAELLRRLAASLAGSQPNATAQAPVPPPTQTEEQKEREWLQEALRRSRELRERQVQTEPPDRRPSLAKPPSVAAESPAKRSAKRAKAKSRPKPKARPKPRRPSRPAPKKRSASRPKAKPKSAKGRTRSRSAKRRR